MVSKSNPPFVALSFSVLLVLVVPPVQLSGSPFHCDLGSGLCCLSVPLSDHLPNHGYTQTTRKLHASGYGVLATLTTCDQILTTGPLRYLYLIRRYYDLLTSRDHNTHARTHTCLGYSILEYTNLSVLGTTLSYRHMIHRLTQANAQASMTTLLLHATDLLTIFTHRHSP